MFEKLVVYLILILCNFNLNPSISLSTPERADNITTLTVVYKYGLALRPEILNGDSSSCNKKSMKENSISHCVCNLALNDSFH